MLELQIANTDVTNGNLVVTWCVDEVTLKYLSNRQVADPQVVIVVAPTENYHSSREYRKVVPLRDLMTYLEFRSKGTNKIWAFISTKTNKNARNSYLSRESGNWSTDILSDDGTEWSSIFSGRYQNDVDGNPVRYVYVPELPAEPISINVPAGVFAKEPPKWEKVWVNHWFRFKPMDQCDYRRRRMLAYSVQPLVVLLDLLVPRFLMLLLSTLWLSRGMTFKYLLHPLRYSVSDAADVLKGGTYAIADLPEDNEPGDRPLTVSYVFRKLWRIFLMPIVILPLWLMYHLHVVLLVLGCMLCVACLIALAFAVASGIIKDLCDSINEWWLVGHQPKSWYMDQDEVDAITCNPSMQKRTSLADLPAKKRTIHLRFQDLKSRVCRPFSA